MYLAARNGFQDLLSAAGQRGITSVCSAHPWVIRAAAAQARDDGTLLLIEATCNQVNQDGGYTGMRPADFRDFVRELAGRAHLPDRPADCWAAIIWARMSGASFPPRRR